MMTLSHDDTAAPRRWHVPIEAVQLAVLFPILAVAAVMAPEPAYATDRDLYETVARLTIVPDCGSLHCFRPLVPWVLGLLPGPSLLLWKLYAALLNAVAGVAVGRLALTFGVTARGAVIAAALSAFGFGAMFTLYDPHTADPLMYAVAPIVFRELWLGRILVATVISSVAVFGKEFAAAPLWIFTILATIERRGRTALSALVAANVATLVWLVLQLTLMIGFNYSYAESPGADLLHGGYLRFWLGHMSVKSALSAVFAVYGPIYLLAVAGFVIGGGQWRRLILAMAPAALLLSYVQQPDRALWNFHFLIIPLAVVALERAPGLVVWSFVATFALANMRLGAQLPIPSSRFSLVIASALAVAATITAVRNRPLLPRATAHFA
jgi:hypothetical protein